MATLVRKIIKANCATGFYDDGVSINLNRVSTLPEDADCLVYPDWHGHSGVRVEKNSNSPVNFSIEYQDASDHQSLFSTVDTELAAARAILDQPYNGGTD